MHLSLLVVALNVLCNYVFIFGHWGFPGLGVVGAAIGTVLAQTIVAVIYAYLFFNRGNRHRFAIGEQVAMSFKKMGVFLRYATPHGVREIIEVSSWHFLFITVAHFGTVALAANNIVIGWYFMFFVPLIGLLQSVSIGVGHLVGAERYGDVPRTLKLHLAIGVSYALLWLLLFTCVGSIFVQPFIGEQGDPAEWQAIKEQSQIVLILAGVWGVFDAMQLIIRSAVNAAGDVLWTFIVTPIVYVLSLILPCVYLMYVASQGHKEIWGVPLLEASWIIACCSLLVLSLVFAYRYFSGVWRQSTVRGH